MALGGILLANLMSFFGTDMLTDEDCSEYATWKGTAVPPTFQGSAAKVQNLIRDNRDGQRERFMFLPGTNTFPDLVIDRQQLSTVAENQRDDFDRIASLDSPFAEKLGSLFARHYGRIGTPDLDIEIAMARIKARAATPPAIS
jgi:hypothetical protein